MTPRRPDAPPPTGAAVVVRCVLVVMACGAPLALVGTLGPAIVEDLELSAGAFGIATSAFFVVNAVVAFPAGRWIDAGSWQTGLRLAGAVATTGLAVGAVAGGQLALAVALAMAGGALGLAMPACARAMTTVLAPSRLGTSMGLLHAAIPTAVMAASGLVAVLALADAWRTAFAACAVATLVFTVTALSSREPHAPSRRARSGALSRARLDPGLLALFLAVTAASMANGVLLTSFVVSTTAMGLELDVAASILAVGTFASVVVRVVGGWAADRAGSTGAVPASVLLGVGGGGALLVAGETGAVIVGSALALGAGLGWPGLLYSAVARRSTDRAGAAIGAIEFGASGGAAFGPAVFGMLLEGRGAATAWYLVAGCLVTAAICSLLGNVGRGRAVAVTAA